MTATRLLPSLLFPLMVVLGGCATEAPTYGEVVTLRAGEGASGYPAPGTVWRLDESDLRKLSPAPFVEPPPPPRLPPPPRPNDPPAAYYGAPYYSPFWYGPSFHYWRGW